MSENENLNDIAEIVVSDEAAEEETIFEDTYKEMSPIRLVLRRFFRSKLSIVGLVMIVFLFLFSFQHAMKFFINLRLF